MGTGARSSLIAAAGAVLLACGVWAIALSAPLRAQGGDTVPGRLAMVTLACQGTSDLRSIDWLAARAARGKTPYYARPTEDGIGLVSTFGPGPGWLGWPFFSDVPAETEVDDDFLRQRARLAAASSVAFSALLLALGLRAVVNWAWALGLAAGAALSFAGVGTLGQGLWQQTAALPFLVAALAAGLGASTRPGLVILALASGAFATWLRPADAPLALGVALFAAARVPAAARTPGLLAAGLLSVLVASLAGAGWNLWHLNEWLPWGQWRANQLAHEDVLVLEPAHVLTALAGLIVSPGRGLVWYAPFVPLGIGIAFQNRKDRSRWLLSGGVLAQLMLMSAFVKWWGGLCFGPRLLAGLTWVACALPVLDGLPKARWQRIALLASFAYTSCIGLLGTYLYDPRRIEISLDPDKDSGRLFTLEAAPWHELVGPLSVKADLRDAPNGPFVYCDPGGLRAP